jgi:hypothetical protein
MIVRAYGDDGSYALAVDDDGRFRGCTWWGGFCVRVLDYRLNLAEVPALDGSGPLLSCVPPAILDLDKLGTGCNLAVDVRGELDLIAGSVETCGIWANCKSFLLALRCRAGQSGRCRPERSRIWTVSCNRQQVTRPVGIC